MTISVRKKIHNVSDNISAVFSKLIRRLLSLLGFNMTDENLIWYFGYGSNIYRERFVCYIIGGQPVGNTKSYEGCRDKTLPSKDKPFSIRNELYFSKQSSGWDNGGVAFVKINHSPNITTLGRLYLITRQQLEDVAKQETSSEEIQTINFDEALARGSTVFKSRSWYGNVLCLGKDNDYPIFTLTNEINLAAVTRPSPQYISTIAKGLAQTLKINQQEAIDYFMNKQGIANNYTIEELTKIINIALPVQESAKE
jgi:hypothetical protein